MEYNYEEYALYAGKLKNEIDIAQLKDIITLMKARLNDKEKILIYRISKLR